MNTLNGMAWRLLPAVLPKQIAESPSHKDWTVFAGWAFVCRLSEETRQNLNYSTRWELL